MVAFTLFSVKKNLRNVGVGLVIFKDRITEHA